MIKKPSGCDSCPLAKKAIGFCPDKKAKKIARFLFIGETPTKSEVEIGEPFTGKNGFVLRNWLMRAIPSIQLAEEKGEIAYANTLRCVPPDVQGRAYPKGEEKGSAEVMCRQYDSIPESITTVVLFGEAPQRVWFKEELDAEDASDRRIGRDVKGVMGRVGREYERDGKRYVFAPHPATILKQPALVAHGQRSLGIAANTEKLSEPEYIRDWKAVVKELGVDHV